MEDPTDQPPGSNACVSGDMPLPRRGLDLYMMFEDSGLSFLYWPDSITAMERFLNDPASAGIGVGLHFFGTSCEPDAYAIPIVPIAPLRGNAARLMAAFPIIPTEGTATLPAMQGAIIHAKEWARQYPERDVAVLLVTAGVPTTCESTVAKVERVVREANQAQPSVPTYVILLGGIGALNTIAVAGGTGDAHVVLEASSENVQTALTEVRSAAQRCSFAWPRDRSPDLRGQSVTVFREHADGPRTALTSVESAVSCDAQVGGFYYDDARVPSAIVLCPSDCTTLGTDRIVASFSCAGASGT